MCVYWIDILWGQNKPYFVFSFFSSINSCDRLWFGELRVEKTYLITWDSEIDGIAQQTWENIKKFISYCKNIKGSFFFLKHNMTKRKNEKWWETL